MTKRIEQRLVALETKTANKINFINYYRSTSETFEEAKKHFFDNFDHKLTSNDIVVCYRRIEKLAET